MRIRDRISRNPPESSGVVVRMRVAVIRMLVVVVLAIVVAACGSPSVLPGYKAGGWQWTAATTGRLAMDGACLVLVGRDGSKTHLVWPSPDTEWDPSTGTVTVRGVRTSVGEEVTLGGGEIQDASPEVSIPPSMTG